MTNAQRQLERRWRRAGNCRWFTDGSQSNSLHGSPNVACEEPRKHSSLRYPVHVASTGGPPLGPSSAEQVPSETPMDNSRRYSIELAVLFSALLATGCSTGRVNERVSYWSKITADRIPSGSTLDNAEAVLAANGLQLRCCVSGPDDKKSYFASEKNVGRFFFTEYSVVVIVNVSQDGHVEDSRVETWGVGF